jgi:hypothetical protein
MLGVIGSITFLTVLGLSLIITRLATIALKLTGLSPEVARFQGRSAFTGTGFTTTEAEKVVNHPVRRKIIMWLMIVRSAGLITIIHPKTPVNDLGESKLHTLFQTMKDVLQTAIEHDADPGRFPDSFLIPHRDEDAHCPQCSGHIDAIKVSGRTSYYCPACQPAP